MPICYQIGIERVKCFCYRHGNRRFLAYPLKFRHGNEKAEITHHT